MQAAGGISLHLAQARLGVERPVPDEAIAPPTGREIVACARYGITEDVLAGDQSPREAVKNCGMRGGRKCTLLDHAAPANISGIGQRDIGQELSAHR